MAVCLVITVPGGTREQYEQVMEGLGDPPLGDGQSYHVAGPTDGDWCVVDVWESREHFDRYLEERLGEHLQAAGLAQPEVTEVAVHTEIRG